MNQPSFSDRLWSGFVTSWGGVISALGVILGLLAFFVTPEKTVPLNSVLLLGALLFCALVALCRTAYEAHEAADLAARPTPPVVRMVRDPPPAYPAATALLLIDPHDALSHASAVTIYIQEHELEVFVAVGTVANIQQDKRVQILVSGAVNERIEVLKKNIPAELSKVIIKPSVPSFLLSNQP